MAAVDDLMKSHSQVMVFDGSSSLLGVNWTGNGALADLWDLTSSPLSAVLIKDVYGVDGWGLERLNEGLPADAAKVISDVYEDLDQDDPEDVTSEEESACQDGDMPALYGGEEEEQDEDQPTGDCLVTLRALSTQPGEDTDNQRTHIFHSKCYIILRIRSAC